MNRLERKVDDRTDWSYLLEKKGQVGDICGNDGTYRRYYIGSVLHRHRGGRTGNINAWYLNTHMVYL